MQALAAAGERIGGPMYRKSTLEDCRAIYQLICELEQKELPYQRFSEIYYQQIQDSRYYCLVYEYNGSVVAALRPAIQNLQSLQASGA